MNEVKTIEIPLLQFPGKNPDLSEISTALDKDGKKVEINVANWKEFNYRPEVTQYTAFTGNEVLLKYRVQEKYVSARYTESNTPVHEDSCVEFFISSGNSFYYNFEFNCIGTASVGYGKQRKDRIAFDHKDVSEIRTYSTLGDKPIPTRKMDQAWELTVAIPFTIFKEKEYLYPTLNQFTANFYKCGDMLPLPHFLSWNPIITEEPDFHRPEFFGKLRFSNS